MRFLEWKKAYPFWVCLFAFVLSSHHVLGQKETSHWFTNSDHRLVFQGDSVDYFNDNLGKSSTEAWASISDKDGDLLFYTDIITVWNGEHEIILGGDKITIEEDRSAHQGCLFIKHPNKDSSNIYLLITTSASENFPKALRCYHIDRTIANGRGGIYHVRTIPINIAEGLAAVHHADGKKIWVALQELNSGSFLIFLVDGSGISTKPVISNVGLAHTNWRYGGIAISPTGNLLATPYATRQEIGIFKFNNLTGKVSDPVYFDVDIDDRQFISLEFSPSGNFLYALDMATDRNPPFNLFQISIDQQSHRIVGDTVFPVPYSRPLQLGMDGKIYSMSEYSFHVIHHPDRAGAACEFEVDAIPFEKRVTWPTLPHFMSSYFRPCQIDLGPRDTLLCEGEGLVLDAAHDFGRQWVWSDGSREPTLSVSQPGTYSVEVTGRNCDIRDTITVRFRDCSLTVPNVFTPNGDGINDTFEAEGLEKTTWSLQVFNRWGKQVYASSHYLGGWDGEDLVDGTYYYHFRSDRLDRNVRGWLMIMR